MDSPDDKTELSLSYPELDAWLATATVSLCEEAREEIRGQVRGEFEEKVRLWVGEGLTEEKAVNRALLELGDPEEAKKGLRRVHLTRSEAKTLERLRDLTWWRLGFAFLWPIGFVAIYVSMRAYGFLGFFVAGYAILVMLATSSGRRLARHGQWGWALGCLVACYVGIGLLSTLTWAYMAEPIMLRVGNGEVVMTAVLALSGVFLVTLGSFLQMYLPPVLKVRRTRMKGQTHTA